MNETTVVFLFKSAVVLILGIALFRALRAGRKYFSTFLQPHAWHDVRDKQMQLPLWDRRFHRSAMRGSDKAPDHTLNQTIHRATWGVRLKTASALVALYLALLYKLDVYAMGALEVEFGSYTMTLVKLGLIAILSYNTLHLFVYRLLLDGSELTVTGPAFQRQTFDLRKLDAVEQSSLGLYRLRFSDGKTARILKYVTGHDEMMQALENARAENQEPTCLNFPRLKRSAAG